jgi:hypothetical protein
MQSPCTPRGSRGGEIGLRAVGEFSDIMAMSQSPVTPEQIAALPPNFRALLQAVIEHYEKPIAALEAEVAALKKSPRNSSLPPSVEHPHARPIPDKVGLKKKPGGQPGHARHKPPLIPTK